MGAEDFGCASASELHFSPVACKVRRLRLQQELQALDVAPGGHTVLVL